MQHNNTAQLPSSRSSVEQAIVVRECFALAKGQFVEKGRKKAVPTVEGHVAVVASELKTVRCNATGTALCLDTGWNVTCCVGQIALHT